MLPKIFRRLFQNEGYGKLLNKEIIPSDITVDGMVRFDAWRKSLIGCLFYLPTTTLPADYGVADGSLFLFEDFPELGEKYESGGFAGLLLNFDASRSNPTYSVSSTVQPPSVKLAPVIYLGKTA